jgi:ABC-2 family transporter protein
MTLPAALFAVRWLVRDTFRQARASGVFWAMVVVTTVCTATCASMGVVGEPEHPPLQPWEDPNYLPKAEADRLDPKTVSDSGVEVPRGELTLFFGAFHVPLTRTRAEAVRFVQVVLAGGVADTFGVLLALIWTAGFLPGFLDPAAASVLVAKPLPRWGLLTGKFLGVIAFVAAQATLFVGLTWLALGAGTGVWDARYWLCVLILLVHFTLFFCVSAFFATLTRSTVASVVGTAAAWVLCWGVNYARHAAAVAAPDGASLASVPVEWAYWLLPKPGDLGLMLVDAVQAASYLARVPVFAAVQERGLLAPELSVITSCLVPGLLLAFAGRRLVRADY